MAAQWRSGATLDVHDEMMRLTRDIAGKTLFDLEVGEYRLHVLFIANKQVDPPLPVDPVVYFSLRTMVKLLEVFSIPAFKKVECVDEQRV